jgi:hypothetical protein
MSREHWRYLQMLLRSLREEGVPGERIGELVAEVASHLEDGGDDPVAEFGRPAELAADLAGREKRLPRVLRAMPIRVLSIVAAMMGAASILESIRSDPARISSGTLGLVIGQALLIVGFAHIATRRMDGKKISSAFTPATIGALLAGAAIVATLSMGEGVLVTVSRSTGLVVGVVLVGSGLLAAWSVDRRIRFPEHATHLDALRKGLGWRLPAAGVK